MRVLIALFLLAPSVLASQTTPGRPSIRDPGAQRMVHDPAPGTLQTTPPAAPPPAGPPPQGIRFDASATYGIFAKIAWNAAPGAAGYEISRAKRDDAACCNATSGPLPANTTSWGDVGLFSPGYYRYTVTVRYADGSVGTDALDLVQSAGAAAPSPVTVQDLGMGRVRIQWNTGVPGTCCVRIAGPGMGPSGEDLVIGGGPLDLPILPAGTHTWQVAAAYDASRLPAQAPKNYGVISKYGSTYVVLAPPSEWVTVSHTVSYGTGRFRISLEGFKAISVTAEDPFRHDGRGDEVFITTQVSEYGRNGSLISTRSLRTPTFGDRQNFPARVQAGTASPQGGVMPNDRYPAEAQLISQLQPATTNNLPFLLWEGTLTEIDNAVILSPAIWESDDGDELVAHYATFQSGAASNLGYREGLNGYVPNTYGRPILDTWNPQRACPAFISQPGSGCKYAFVPPISGWRDEPMNMNSDHSHTPTSVAINWRMANSLTTVNPATVLEIPFKNRQTNWEYTLYVRVEKVAPGPQVVPVTSPSSTRRAAGR